MSKWDYGNSGWKEERVWAEVLRRQVTQSSKCTDQPAYDCDVNPGDE